MAETKKKTTKTTKAPEKMDEITPKQEKMMSYSQDEVQAMIAAAVAEALKKQEESRPQAVLAVAQPESVTVMYIAEVSPENVLIVPGYGSFRPTSTLDIPKQEFKGKFMTPLVRKLLDKRHLIVLDGLTKDERQRFNCDYKEGEVMTEQVFDNILKFDTEKLVEVFKLLCEEHKRFVCRKIIGAYEKKDNHISIEKMQAINNLTKDIVKDGLLKPIIDDYGKNLA